jgi:hypothetical protein
LAASRLPGLLASRTLLGTVLIQARARKSGVKWISSLKSTCCSEQQIVFFRQIVCSHFPSVPQWQDATHSITKFWLSRSGSTFYFKNIMIKYQTYGDRSSYVASFVFWVHEWWIPIECAWRKKKKLKYGTMLAIFESSNASWCLAFCYVFFFFLNLPRTYILMDCTSW